MSVESQGNRGTTGYLLSLSSSLTYSVWLIGSGFLILASGENFPIFYLLIIMVGGTFFSLFFGIPRTINRATFLSVLSGILFAIANFSMYFLIKSDDIAVASSFAEFNVLFLPILLYLSGDRSTKFLKYSVGLFLVTFGLIVENIQSTGKYIISPLSVIVGIVMGFLYAAATYLVYAATKGDHTSNSNIFYVFLSECGVLLIFWSILKFQIEPAPTLVYISISLVISVSLVVALALEVNGYRSLRPLGFRQVTLGNILSNLELLPVIVFSFILYPSLRVQYTLGLFLVTVGILVVSVDLNNFQRLHK
ncbi:MAG: hypothetical protein QXN66_02030 [Thermoplasmatales archaeon]